MNILYEDSDILVCQKEAGFSSEISHSLPSLANEVLQKYGYVGVIHRLDMNVGGAILYAKNKSAASYYSACVSQNKLNKEYLAVIHGIPDTSEGTFKDFLFKDSSKNKVFVVKRMRKGVKEAVLSYNLIGTVYIDNSPLSLVKITLHTGRSHQIRAQFSSRKMPLVGDGKYGSHENRCNISLWSYRLCFPMVNGLSNQDIKSLPDTDAFPWNLFKNLNDLLKTDKN